MGIQGPHSHRFLLPLVPSWEAWAVPAVLGAGGHRQG